MTWPQPKEIPDLGVFKNIDSIESLNEIIGNPQNHKIIIENENLYSDWVLPKAINICTKKWFDNIKNKRTMGYGIPFPLFSEEEIYHYKSKSIDETPSGKAMISKLTHETDRILTQFISNGRGKYNNVYYYIVKSLRQKISKDISELLGFRLISKRCCNFCNVKYNSRVFLVDVGDNKLSCPTCAEKAKSCAFSSEGYEYYEDYKIYGNHYGISCICHNVKCPGKFIPLNYLMCPSEKIEDYVKQFNIKSTQYFKHPGNYLINEKVKCPFCNDVFIINDVIDKGLGYRGKAGYITGVPSLLTWVNEFSNFEPQEYVDNILIDTSEYADNLLIRNQSLDMVRKYLNKKIEKFNPAKLSGYMSYFFYSSILVWLNENEEDAFTFLFSSAKTNSAYWSIFCTVINTIDHNINQLNKFDIYNLSDLKWFENKYNYGPIIEFNSIVNNCWIKNEAEFGLRLVKIYSIKKGNCEYINDLEFCKWQKIKLNPKSNLQNGDTVSVRALVMPNNAAHTPIRRIMRFRESIMNLTKC